MNALGAYTAKLHEQGIYHLDYSAGNILVGKKNGRYHFSLIDINRMYFGRVGIKKGCRNFARLWGSDSDFDLIIGEYAEKRGFDKARCMKLALKYRDRFWEKKGIYTFDHFKEEVSKRNIT